MKKEYKAFIFDMDGVLRCGNTGVPGAGDLLKLIHQKNIPSLILTNECRYTKDKIKLDLEQMNITIPDSWTIYTAADCMNDFLSKIYKSGYILVLGEDGLKTTLKANPLFKDRIKENMPDTSLTFNMNLYLIIGSMDKLRDDDIEEATKWIRCGAKIVTTCPDVADPGSKGDNSIMMPGHTLHILKKLIPCTSYCVGKPNPIMIRRAVDILLNGNPDLKYDDVLFIGDSLDTDIKAAFEFNMDSALVLTGNTRMYMVSNNIIQPTYIFHSVREIFDELNSGKP